MKKFTDVQRRRAINTLIVLLPVFVAVIWLYYEPYYLFVSSGDPNYHLPRAREIMETPLKGLLWDNFRCYPQGKAINHQPLYHLITAAFWYVGGVRFAFSVMAISQIVITVGVASIFGRRYGTVAGFTSGFLAFFTMRPDTLIVPTPSAFLFPLILITIYLAVEKKEFAYVPLLISLWTHPGALFIFPVIYHFFFLKDRNRLINGLLFSSWFFWIGYWSYFGLLKGQMGQHAIAFDVLPALGVIKDSLITSLANGYLSILAFGAYGFYLTRERVEAKVILLVTFVIVVFTLSYGDYNRYPQYIVMPLAIFGGVAFQSGYADFLGVIKNKTVASLLLLLSIFVLFMNVPSVVTTGPPALEKGFASRHGFEWPNENVKSFVETNTEETEVVYAEGPLVDKIVWMTGRKVSNCGTFGAPKGFVPQTQRFNLLFIPDVVGEGGLFRPIVIEEGVNISVEQMYEIVYREPKLTREDGTFVITKEMTD